MTAKDFTNRYLPHIRTNAMPTEDQRDTSFQNNAFLKRGISYPVIAGNPNLVAVCFKAGKITYMPVNNGYAAISFEFSGCYMAKVHYNNQWYACHISTGSGEADCKEEWNNFIRSNAIGNGYCVLFKPNENQTIRECWENEIQRRPPNEHLKIQIWGLITSDNICYSLVVDTINNYEVLAGPIQISPIRDGIIPDSQQAIRATERGCSIS